MAKGWVPAGIRVIAERFGVNPSNSRPFAGRKRRRRRALTPREGSGVNIGLGHSGSGCSSILAAFATDVRLAMPPG
jgi:hypothetical protein